MEIGLLILIAFGIVGSVEARVRALLKRHERQLDAAREDLARIERKLTDCSATAGWTAPRPRLPLRQVRQAPNQALQRTPPHRFFPGFSSPWRGR